MTDTTESIYLEEADRISQEIAVLEERVRKLRLERNWLESRAMTKEDVARLNILRRADKLGW